MLTQFYERGVSIRSIDLFMEPRAMFTVYVFLPRNRKIMLRTKFWVDTAPKVPHNNYEKWNLSKSG